MWKSLWASSPQVGMGIWGKLCELVTVGPGLGRLGLGLRPGLGLGLARAI